MSCSGSRTRHLIGLALVPIAFGVVAQGDFDLSWSTVDAGGEMFSTGGEFELSGTIGQHDSGMLSGAEFQLSGGFWFETPPSDCNNTGGVDLLDYDDFEACLTGPGASVAEGCECFDVDRSGSVDLLDFAVAQSAFTG